MYKFVRYSLMDFTWEQVAFIMSEETAKSWLVHSWSVIKEVHVGSSYEAVVVLYRRD
jgi:hypothetical protein